MTAQFIDRNHKQIYNLHQPPKSNCLQDTLLETMLSSLLTLVRTLAQNSGS